MLKKFASGVLIAAIIMSLASLSVISVAAAPYTDIIIRASGRSIIEAVHFDTENYHDNDGEGNKDLRPDEQVGTEYGGSGFEGNIGWTGAGEWVQYTVQVEADGRYKFEAYLASAADPAGNILVSYNGNPIGATSSGDNWGWQEYDWYDVGEVDMTAGTQVIRVDFVDGNTNFAALRVSIPGEEPEETTTTTTTTAATADEETTADDGGEEADDGSQEETVSDSETTTAASSGASDSDNSMLLYLGIAGLAIVIIIVIVVFAMKKKKA